LHHFQLLFLTCSDLRKLLCQLRALISANKGGHGLHHGCLPDITTISLHHFGCSSFHPRWLPRALLRKVVFLEILLNSMFNLNLTSFQHNSVHGVHHPCLVVFEAKVHDGLLGVFLRPHVVGCVVRDHVINEEVFSFKGVKIIGLQPQVLHRLFHARGIKIEVDETDLGWLPQLPNIILFLFLSLLFDNWRSGEDETWAGKEAWSGQDTLSSEDSHRGTSHELLGKSGIYCGSSGRAVRALNSTRLRLPLLAVEHEVVSVATNPGIWRRRLHR